MFLGPSSRTVCRQVPGELWEGSTTGREVFEKIMGEQFAKAAVAAPAAFG